MAIGESLRYYRRQFNPEAAYGDGSGGGSPIISMYNPEAEARYFDAVSQRQERFDTSKMAIAQEIARVGEMETYDLAELNNRLKSFESDINTTVKEKYNGDYGAAANEIAKLIGTERSNPFYHFNKQKVEMGKAYLDAKMKLGANFLSSGNPFNVNFQDWQKGKTFEFTPINSSDVTQQSAAVFQNLSKTMMNNPTLRSVAGGQYFEYVTQNGFRDEAEALDFIQNNPMGQQMMKQVYDSMPELAGVENQEAVVAALTKGAFAGIGNRESRLVADQSYLDALQQSRMKGSAEAEGVTGKIVDVGTFGIRKDKSTGKDVAIPIHALNPLYGNSVSEANEINKIKAQLNLYLQNVIQPGDIAGVTPKDSKLIKDKLEDMDIRSFSFVPSEDPKEVFDLVLNITGTPMKTKNNRSPMPVEASVKITSTKDKLNMFADLCETDPIIYSTYMDILKKVNPEGYNFMVGEIKKAKEQ